MKRLRLLLVIMLMILMLLPQSTIALNAPYAKGDQMQDFEFTTYDGQKHSLYELLVEKEAVMLNIWATWCPPCKQEFPFMQEAYEAYRDQVEVIALSCEASDTNEKLASFAHQNGLTFKVGRAPQELLNLLNVSSIPLTLMIDRYGTICFMNAGAQPNAEAFVRLFEAFLGDDYGESIILDGIPEKAPDVEPSSEEALKSALGTDAYNLANKYIWPMTVTDKDGRMVLESTNTGTASSRAAVVAKLDAKAGEAIVVTFKTSTESLYDLMTISVNGKVVKHFGGVHDWTSYAIPVESTGVNTIQISYSKDHISDSGDDKVWIDSISVVEDAQAALAANAEYPVAEYTDIVVMNPEARAITITDPAGLLEANFGNVRCYVVNSDQADLNVKLSADVDPECALLYSSYDKAQLPITQILSKDGYSAATKVDSAKTTRTYCTYAAVYPKTKGGPALTAILFRDEENLDAFVELNSLGEWHYAENEEHSEALLDGQSSYRVICLDPEGNPVQGVLLQVCNDEMCQVYMTDAEGIVAVTLDSSSWEVHVLQAPEQYASDPIQLIQLPPEGGDITLTLKHR